MKDNLTYNIIDFTEYPGPRYIDQGEFSGEKLYISFLKPLVEKARDLKVKLIIDLDGTAGYAASFIDEIFGNIIYDFGDTLFIETIEIVSQEEPEWIDMINDSIVPQWQEKKEMGYARKPKFD